MGLVALMAQLRRDFLIHAEKDGNAIFDARVKKATTRSEVPSRRTAQALNELV
jgi:hypothetical protein